MENFREHGPMNTRFSIRPVWGLLLGLGLFLISGSFVLRMVREERSKIERSTRILEQLHELVQKTEAQESAMQQLAQGEAKSAEDLLSLLNTPDGFRLENSSEYALSDGFKHHRVEVHLSGVYPAEITHLLRQAENARPPLRATLIDVETREGTLHGKLHLESFQR
jgi:hypothetical protein